MKVLNLHCVQGHVFEGWFANEEDYQRQHTRALLSCPVCNSPDIRKGLSAPRLNLSGAQPTPDAAPDESQQHVVLPTAEAPTAMVQAWLELSRRIVAATEDVGERFAHEARKMHYGEAEDRGIRGRVTTAEARELLDEGIDVLPLALPEVVKHTLQ